MTSYILVRCEDDDVEDLVELCKQFEESEGVETAIIVDKGTGNALDMLKRQKFLGYTFQDIYVGEFYSTPQAVRRILA